MRLMKKSLCVMSGIRPQNVLPLITEDRTRFGVGINPNTIRRNVTFICAAGDSALAAFSFNVMASIFARNERRVPPAGKSLNWKDASVFFSADEHNRSTGRSAGTVHSSRPRSG
jgi:hypothetical protein